MRPPGLEVPPGGDPKLVNLYLVVLCVLAAALVVYVCVLTARAV